jgi:hypothetical protein
MNLRGLRFEVLIAVTTQNTVLWDVLLCCLVGIYLRFGGTCCLRIQGRTSSADTLYGVTTQKNVSIILRAVFRIVNHHLVPKILR